MPLSLPPQALVLWWTVVGLFVGSFLNVCIHRYSIEDETPTRPRRSRCPRCRTTLTWRENIPLLSWLVQLGRCRTCRWRIPARYPLIEALNAALWWWVITTVGTEQVGLWIVASVILSGLLVATVVDFQHFEIPDGVSIGGMIVAPLACLLVPELHSQSRIALEIAGGGAVGPAGSLLAGLAGMVVGGGAIWSIGWIGTKLYGADAMGFGDVKLLAAGGGFVGPGGALAALAVAALTAGAFGIVNILRFLFITRSRASQRGRQDPWSRSVQVARTAGRYLPFGPFLALGIGIALLHWDHVVELWPILGPLP